MVAVAQFIPKDPKEQESVLEALRAQPDLQDVILEASAKAQDVFTDVRITLDTRQYEEWDAPVRMFILVGDPWPGFKSSSKRYIEWLSHEARYDADSILIMPVWNGPLASASK
jgi:hypothetical protein